MEDGIIIGTGIRGGYERPIQLWRADRRQHTYVIGQTGVGKSTLLRNMILQDIEAGEGVGVIDPHGDLAEEILEHIPPWRIADVVYFNATDFDHPIGLNMLTKVSDETRPLAASSAVSIFRSIWADSWGPRLEYILYGTVAALLECEDVSLLGIQRMLVDRRYRYWVLRQVTDPSVRSFWLDEFEEYDPRFMREAIAPIQNKVGQLLMASPVRNILGQTQNRFDPRFMMDHGRILIANLAKGKLGADKANLLGAILVSRFQLAAMERAGTSESQRRDYYLYVDEFHNFATDSFASILSESRKYRLNLILSHQFISQVSEPIRDAVFGNVGTMVSFRVGGADGDVLARQFGGYPPTHFTGLSNHAICIKPIQQGQLCEAFTGQTHPPMGTRYGRHHSIIRSSRQRFGTPKAVVEDKINRWMRRSE